MVRETREKDDYSPAELTLLDKFQTITEKRALQDARNRLQDSSKSSKSAEQEKDARQIAIDIIRSRRKVGSSHPPLSGELPAKRTKIKLTPIPSKDTSKIEKVENDTVLEQPEANKKRKVHVVQVRRRMTAPQKQQEKHDAPQASGPHALFIDNLPEYCTSDDLYRYFAEQWSLGVVSAGVYQGCCSGLVTCGSLEDAEYVMNEQLQHECELGGNILSITWATEDDIKALDMNTGIADVPAPVDPRLQQRVKDTENPASSQDDANDGRGRNMVSYDDL